MSENQPYIGAPVTLISSLDVRYEGTLFTIDPNESTVALQNVRCLGTENRQTGSKSIPPSETVYEFIIFRGENIKSINIAEEKFSKQNELNDPSILKLGPKGTTEPKRKGNNGYHDRQYQNRRDPAKYRQHRQDYDGHRGGYRRDNRRQYQTRGYNNGYNNQYDRRNNDRRGRYNNRRNQNNRGRRQDTQRQQGPRHNPGDAKFLTGRDENQEKITITEEFDFEKATFDKTNVLADDKKADAPAADENKKEEASADKAEEASKEETSEKTEETADAADKNQQDEDKKEESPEPAEPAPKPFEYKYNPEKSFFDDLDLVDRSNMDFKARRKIDAQTFGEEASTYKVRRRRRRGGSNRRRRPQQRYHRY